MRNQVLATNNETLPYLTDQDRLNAYNLIVTGCSHVWSKGKLQQDKAKEILTSLLPLSQTDPYFLAHLASYALRKTKSKDLQLFTSYANALSSADGMPFSPGSKYSKPNLRIISAAAVHQLDPIMVAKLLEITTLKYSVANVINEGTHFPRFLRNSVKKYLRYREDNINILKKAKQAGMGPTIQWMYKILHQSPSDQAAAILRWQQKDKKITFEKSDLDFSGLDDKAIAEKIQKEKLSVLGVLGALPRQMSPVVAVAILEQCSGNQAVILRKTFEDAGVLTDPEVLKLFTEKITTASTALDRAKTLSETASADVKKVMMQAKSESRKEQVGDIGKVFVHIDASGSMHEAFDVACEKGSVIAEMVQNPEQNFAWGYFDERGSKLPLPQEFVEDAFRAVLYGKHAGGGTDAFALYPEARRFGATIDVHISDGGHNTGDLAEKIREFHTSHPELPKPKAMVWIQVNGTENTIKDGYEANQIPVAVLKPGTLSESALVAQAVKTAMEGPIAVVEDIMSTELLKLPDYYFTL